MQSTNNKLNDLNFCLRKKKIDYLLISTSDEFLNEYVPDFNMRLKWLTNFSGSNGYALISGKENFFFTDGRYTLQAKKELHKSFEIFDLKEVNIIDFLREKLMKKKILVDTRCLTKDFVLQVLNTLKYSKNKIIHDKNGLVDSLWINRPKEKNRKFFILNKKYAGESFQEKLKKIKPKDNTVLVISAPESVCWLLNIRGYDLDNTPLVFSRLIISKNKVEIFINKQKIPDDFSKHYSNINIIDMDHFAARLKKIKNKKVQIDNQISYFYYKILSENELFIKDDPCKILKSKKNNIEVKCSRKVHIFDSISLIKFFHWLEKVRENKDISEFEASQKLENFKKECKEFFSLSFPIISATGPNASVIHYKPKKKSLILKDNDLFLCDSGGQYFGGTTDITRTIHLGKGKPKLSLKNIYTRVLIGHINLSTIKFPAGTKGFQLDSIARVNLWNAGLDYNHGTGHGVGSFLGVHEGPQSISKNSNNVALEPGMIISNEPGFYKDKNFGIRIENLVLVKKSSLKNFYEFETLSLFPYEKKLIDFKLLSNSQKKWIYSYHKKIYKKVSPYLSKQDLKWLKNKI